MSMEWEGFTVMNMTGIFDYCIYHTFNRPGDYYIRVTVMDAYNRTAQDVRSVYVDLQGTVLTLNVSPDHVNSSNNEKFMLAAYLASNSGSPIADTQLMFYYGNNATETDWLPMAAGETNQNGYVRLFFSPPFDGFYKFKVSYVGDDLHTPSEAEYGDAIVTPEFPFPVILLVSIMLPIVVSRLRFKKAEHWKHSRIFSS